MQSEISSHTGNFPHGVLIIKIQPEQKCVVDIIGYMLNSPNHP